MTTVRTPRDVIADLLAEHVAHSPGECYFCDGLRAGYRQNADTILSALAEAGFDVVRREQPDHRPAYWTHDDRAAEVHRIGHLYYFAPVNRTQGPYLKQITVEAIVDVARDGTLAGVELVDPKMPPPPTGASHV